MAVEWNDYVKNIEKKDNLKQELRDRIDDEKFVQKLDQDVEKSFQQFTESIKSSLTGNETKEELQDRFNGWLDRQMKTLDSFKDNEIAKDIIWPITFELQNFSTATELWIFQSQLNEQKDNTQHTEIVSVNGKDLQIDTFKDETWEKINPNDIAELFNKNFERKDELLNLLKQWWLDNVKKFQRIIAEQQDDQTDNDLKWTNKPLWKYWVDGKFGWKTMEAFKNYVTKHKIETTQSEQTNEAIVTEDQEKTQDPTASNPKNNDWQGRYTATAEFTAAQTPATPKWSPVERPTEDPNKKAIDEFQYDTNKQETLNKTEAENFVKQAKDLGLDNLQFSILKTITPEVAQILAGFKWELYLTWLEELSNDVLNEFINGECTKVHFKWGQLLKNDDKISIYITDEKTYSKDKITNDILTKLINWNSIPWNTWGSETKKTWTQSSKTASTTTSTSVTNTSKTTNTEWKSVKTEWETTEWSDIKDNTWNNEENFDVQQQYEWIWYNVDNPEITKEASTDEEAIQYLTKWSWKWVFFIARLFGKKKHNAELSIVDANYEPTWQEKKDLNNLNKYLLDCKDNPTEVFTKIFEQNKDFWDNENLWKLYDLYRECRKDQNWTKKWAYLKKVMWLLENYFVRWRKGKDWKIITTFKDMYNNELLWIRQDLEKKDKKAAKKLSEDEKAQLKETWWTTTEAVNTKTRIAESSEKFADFREKYGFDSNAETQFAMCLCDLNADGRIDSRDMNAKTWQELFNLIRDAKVDQKYWILEKWPMYNILNFAKIKAEQDGHTNTAEFLKWIDLNGTDEEIMNKIKERPLTIQYLRYMLINSPMNMANNIIRYGWVKIEIGNTGDDLMLDKETREAINKIMSDEKFEEIYWNAYQQLIEQGLNDTPEIKKKLRPIIALALFESSWSYMWGISWWVDLSLWNAWDIAFMLGAGVWPDWNIMAWISVAYWKSWALGKRKWSIISVWVSWWFNIAEWQFVPMVIWSLWFDQMINGPKLEKTLEERSAKFLWIDGNVWVIWWIPVRWVWLSYSQDKMKWLNITYESIKWDLGNTLKESLKDQWPNSTDKTEIRTQMIASIKTALESRYWRTKEQELDQAAQNIFGWISYYLTEIENPSKITDEQKTAIIEKVAENYANQWRNHAMSELNWTKELERVRVWVEFLAWYWPIPMASISIKKYGNLTANETVESMENYYQRLSSGIWMEYIDNSVSTEWNDEWYLTATSITYLNSKLSVLSPSGDVPPIIKIINWDKYDLQIPKNLCKYANISYNPELENYMKYDESSDSFMIPANIKMWLLTYSRTNDGKYNLILWDFKKWDWFKDLDINSKPEWDTTKYEWKEWELQITESAINGNEEMKKLFENPEFPLSECVESKDWKVYFKEKTWFEIAIERGWILWFPQIWILSAPEYGMLQITKAEDGTYSATFDDSIKDKLTIKYVDVKKANEYIANSQQEFGFENAFDQYKELNDMFNSIEVRLSRLDDAQWWNYADFMDYASSMIDGVLDENDYDKAFDKLKDMLSRLNSRDLSDTNLSALKQKIDGWDLSNVEKTLIVDRFKMLFSYHINLTDGQRDGANLVSAINGRWNVYERLTWYSWEAFPLAWQNYREKILNQLKDKTSLSREVWPSLMGMTAFYRYNPDWRRITEWRWYSMTEMWRTTVLWWAYEELTDDASRNRFISNLKKSEAHQAILSETITRKIQSVPWLEWITINSDQVITLLEWKELDISWKKFTIEMKYMFYLLWECGNESIWANLEKITIKGIGGGWDGETWTTTVEIWPETSYRDVAGLSIDWVAAESSLNIGTTRSQTYWIAVGNKKKEPEPQDDPRSNPNGWDDSDDPRSTPGSWDDPDNPWSGPGGWEDPDNPWWSGWDNWPIGWGDDGLD